MAKTITAIIGDLQVGGNTAIAPPKFTIHRRDSDEEQVVQANRLQSWLWDCWQDYWDYVYSLCGGRGKRMKNRLVVFLMGDLVEGNHHRSTQIVQEPADQARIAFEILEPVLLPAGAVYGVIGTEAHSGIAGVDEAAIYERLGVQYAQHWTLDVDGIIHDLKHHGRVGGRPWTSQAASMAVEAIVDYAESGKQPPDYVWRGHNHRIDDSGYKIANTRALCVPSWQLKTMYGHRVATNTRSDIGGFIMDGDRLDDSRARYKGQPDGIRIVKV